jgi:membrane-associated phospholipid phosphatase
LLQVLPSNASGDETAVAASRALRSWNSGQLIAAGVVLALAAGGVLSADFSIAAYLREHPLTGDLARLVRLAEVFAWGGTVALIILTAALLDPRRWRVVPPLVVGAFGAGLVADGLKLLVARLRPELANSSGATETFLAWLPLLNRDALAHPYGYALQSFPSGHAATAAGIAVALALLYPRGRWLFASFATLACFQRMVTQAHFASDVLAGAAIGCLVGAAWQASRWSIGERAAAA